MALDEALMAAGRDGFVAVRCYGWDPPCLSLGRNQRTAPIGPERRKTLRSGLDIVRRPTGGRSVYHGPELTYAVAAPERLWGGPRAIYRRIHEVIADALEAIGAPLDRASGPAPGAGPPGRLAPDARECFVAAAPHEITAGGRKLVGSAQWRHRGAVLQHGSILIRNEQGRARLETSSAGASAARAGPAAVALEDLLADPPDLNALEARIIRGLADAVGSGGPVRAAPVGVGNASRALEAKYRSEDWTWRR